MKLRRLFSIIIIISFLITTFEFDLSFASQNGDIPGICMVMDFTGESVSKNISSASYQYSKLSQSSEVYYGDAGYSLKKELTSEVNKNLIYTFNNDADWTKYSTFNIRIKTTAPNQKFALVFFSHDTYSTANSNKGIKFVTAESYDDEWTVYSVSLSDVEAAFKNSENGKSCAMFYLSCAGFGLQDYPCTDGEYMYIDTAWLETDSYGDAMNITDTNIKHNSGFISPEIYGDNTISFAFENALWNGDYSEAISVYEINGEVKELTAQKFSVNVNENMLMVAFDSPLNDNTHYRVIIEPDAIYDESGRVLKSEYTLDFLVGLPPKIFEVISYSENELDLIDEFIIEFNTELLKETDFSDYITVYESGFKVQKGISYTSDGKTLCIEFDKTHLSSGEYDIRISEDFTDAYGNLISGNLSYNHYLISSSTIESTDLITVYTSASNASIKGCTMTSDVTYLYGQTMRMPFDATKEQVNFDLTDTSSRFDITKMSHLNFRMYSPFETGNTVQFVVSNPDSSKYDYISVPVDFEGWKLISIPLSDLPNTKSAGRASRIRINFGGFGNLWDAQSYVMLDDTWFSANEPCEPEIVSYITSGNKDEMPVVNASVTFVFNQKISSNHMPEIKITDDALNEYSDYDVMFLDDAFTVTFGKLSPGADYVMRVEGVVGAEPMIMSNDYAFRFKADSVSNCNVSEITFDGAEVYSAQNSIRALYTLINSSEQKAPATLNLVIYDDNGNIKEHKTDEISIEPESQSVYSMECGAVKNASYAKAFVTDKFGKLISDYFVMINSVGKYEFIPFVIPGEIGKESVKIENAVFDGELLEISLKAQGSASNILLTLTDENNNLITLEPVFVESSKIENWYYKMGKSSESVMINIFAYAGNFSDEFELTYISSADRHKLVTIANEGSQDEIFSYIKSKAEFLCDGYSDELINDASMIIKEGRPYDSYQDVTEVIFSVPDILDDLNSKIWSSLADYITDNYKLLLVNNKSYQSFEKSTAKEKNQYCKSITKSMPFGSLSEFRKLFDSVMKTGIKNDNPSSGSGGGKSKTNTLATITPNAVSVPESEDNFVITDVFTDLDAYSWAQNDISLLYEKGIVSSASDNKFRPDSDITREEFVKLLVVMLYGNVTEVNYEFCDQKLGAWYSPYVSKAYESGITLGRPDGTFGIGEKITREDMVTMAYRAMKLNGTLFENSYISDFNDKSDISNYALEGIDAFVSAGIVNGMSDGTFSPKAYAQRVQAAKIISGLYSLIN